MQEQPIYLDDLELLAVMLRLHDADQLHYQTGEQLLQHLGGSPGLDASRNAFTRLLHVAAEDELMSFDLIPPLSMPAATRRVRLPSELAELPPAHEGS